MFNYMFAIIDAEKRMFTGAAAMRAVSYFPPLSYIL